MLVRARLLRNLITNRNFSLFSTPPKIKDWQYVEKIHKSLKQNNINQAINYLINSRLDNIVLDRQTFYNVHLKMYQAKVDRSYQEVAYKLYRQTFSPHILIAEWMKLLVDTENPKLQQMLQKDFKAINLEMPKKTAPAKSIKQSNKSQSSTKSKNPTQQPAQKTKKLQQQQPQKNNDQKNNQKNINSELTQKLAQILLDPSTIEKLLTMVKNNHDFKIVIHDFQLQMKSDDKNQLKHMEDIQQFQEEQEEDTQQISQAQELLYRMDNFLDILSSISKIKVGKVDITILNKTDNNGQNKDK